MAFNLGDYLKFRVSDWHELYPGKGRNDSPCLSPGASDRVGVMFEGNSSRTSMIAGTAHWSILLCLYFDSAPAIRLRL